jgi:membrane-associated phospholipid phosphatase
VLGDSAELTDQHKAIAEYWADGQGTETLPGHWCLLAQWVSARDRHGLDQDVVLFFALGGALHDAAVAAWDAKRAFDSVRPVSAIRLLFAGEKVCAWGGLGQGTTLIKGEQWQPYIPTPPFAEYVSGHSTFSAAAAEVLARSTGSDRFGGIHIRDGDLVGRVLGRLVGLRAWLAASALVGMRARARSGVAA